MDPDQEPFDDPRDEPDPVILTPEMVIEAKRCKRRISSGHGRRCRNRTIAGQKYCLTHGGAGPKTIKRAQESLETLAPMAVAVVEEALANEGVKCALCGHGYVTKLQLQAAQMVFDRVGLGPELKIFHSGHITMDVLVEKMTDEEFKLVDEVMVRVMARARQEQKEEQDQSGD